MNKKNEDKKDFTRIEELDAYVHPKKTAVETVETPEQPAESPAPSEENPPIEDPFANTSAVETSDISEGPVTIENEGTVPEPTPEVDINPLNSSSAPDASPTPTEPVSPTPKREELKSVGDFINAFSYGPITTEANPPFSILIENIHYQEDADEILSILKEHELLNASNASTWKHQVEMGRALIPQIGEYSAIYLVNRLRKLNIDLSMGPSSDIHPTESYEHDRRGTVGLKHLHQNKLIIGEIETNEPLDILLTTASSFEDRKIVHYLEILSEHVCVSEEDLVHHSIEHMLGNDLKDNPLELPPEILEDLKNIAGLRAKEFEGPLNSAYALLCNNLKKRAGEIKANGIIGVRFELEPFDGHDRYKLSCTGHAVICE